MASRFKVGTYVKAGGDGPYLVQEVARGEFGGWIYRLEGMDAWYSEGVLAASEPPEFELNFWDILNKLEAAISGMFRRR